jgi:squalene-hopene/tetraprenyl-beta-curcumene cyclase
MQQLIFLRNQQGNWRGALSSSALSTATAVFALARVDKQKYSWLIQKGLDWLAENQNSDGGWGDTVLSISNISTTMLCWSAFTSAPESARYEQTFTKAQAWLSDYAGSLDPDVLIEVIYKQYGKDRTFSVPILTMCAIAGRLGDTQRAWESIQPLPFELAALPHQLFKWLRLSVVSYALPALIAMGHANFHNRKPANPFKRLLRAFTKNRTLKILQDIQPDNGGFLEATTLTSFVIISLTAAEQTDNSVVSKGVDFLVRSVRNDGSWPIDTDLATWVTTLSINALAANPDFEKNLTSDHRISLKQWLLSQQYRHEHPYTHACPGGWAWTDLPGGVPDADDTAGALIALKNLNLIDDEITGAVQAGITWLLGLQNSDGGVPTFCRGWSDLPFDRSAPDLTAHAITAMNLWRPKLARSMQRKMLGSITKALAFLIAEQKQDGSWIPLWFGNQFEPRQLNPTYGTTKVLIALNGLMPDFDSACVPMIQKGVEWLLAMQNADNGWGKGDIGISSIEETALAVDALSSVVKASQQNQIDLPIDKINSALSQAAAWLIRETEKGTKMSPSPIGLYFARLWYFEKMYPMIFTLSALQKVHNLSP